MSSSTFEVIETENESEKEISFGLEACEENGIESQEEGEVQKDHTYTKDPDDSSVSYIFFLKHNILLHHICNLSYVKIQNS